MNWTQKEHERCSMCPAAATQSIDGPELRTLDDCQGRMLFTGVLHSLNLVGIRGSLETIGVGRPQRE